MRRKTIYAALQRACVALALIATGSTTPAFAELRFSTMTDPTARIDDGPRNMSERLAGVLGTAAPEVTTGRRAQLFDALGLKRGGPRAGTAVAYTEDFVSSLPAGSGDAQWACLSEALYFEARGESVEGIFAVAEVILNRVDDARFPSTICGVVQQGTGRKHQCQFSYACDGIADDVHEQAAYDRVSRIARAMVSGGARELTDGALYYHTRAVSPSWSRRFDRTATIGAHHFYSQA